MRAYSKRPCASRGSWNPSRRAGQRGRPAIYGPERIELAKRAGQKRGWQREEMTLYGDEVVKVYKTFLATWRPAAGVIRVVVKEESSWRAYSSTDITARGFHAYTEERSSWGCGVPARMAELPGRNTMSTPLNIGTDGSPEMIDLERVVGITVFDEPDPVNARWHFRGRKGRPG